MPRPVCSLCHYQLSDFDDVCPKCKGKGVPKLPAPAPVQATPSPMPYNPTIPRPAPVVERKGISPLLIAGLLLVPIVGGAAFLRFSGMELRPKDAAPIATSAPTPAVAAVAPVVVTPTALPQASPTPVITRQKSVATSRPTSREEREVGGTPTLTSRGFDVFSQEALDAIRSASTPQEAARIGLDLLTMSNEAMREKKRADVKGDGSQELMWNYAGGLFNALADFASARVQYLDGTMFEGEYKARNRAIDQQCSAFARLADMRRPKTESEQQRERELDAVRKSINGNDF